VVSCPVHNSEAQLTERDGRLLRRSGALRGKLNKHHRVRGSVMLLCLYRRPSGRRLSLFWLRGKMPG
jgi:hypothetical protein